MASAVAARAGRRGRLAAVAVGGAVALAASRAVAAEVKGPGATGSARAAALAPAVVERRLGLMGTTLRVEIAAADRSSALAASERAVRALEATERRLSTWLPDSELARLNRAPAGDFVTLSSELAEELAAAEECRALTAGAFDAGVGALVDLWDLRGAGRLPAPRDIARVRPAASAAQLELRDAAARRRVAGLRLEEGGFGKGAGLDRALAALAADGRATGALLDLGGQVAVAGAEPRELAIADPRDRARAAVVVRLASGSLSTSANGERGRWVDGVRVGHLLDPRTGRPAPDFGAVTVWAPRALLADCLSTGLFVLGPERALAWGRAHPELGVLVLEVAPGGLRARATGVLAERFVRAAADVAIRIAPAGAKAFSSTPGSPRALRSHPTATGRSRGPERLSP